MTGVCANPGRLVMYAWRSMQQHQANSQTKSKCNQICELDTSHLEGFFQAASGNESDGERKKLKTAGN
jgi:uncharacterized caspase-like protein